MPIPGEFKNNILSEKVSIVLVNPQQSLNIGSVARAMMNLGFSNLILVKPEKYDARKACVTARWASGIIEKALFYETLTEALSEFADVIGFGGRYDQNRIENIALPEWAEKYPPSRVHKTALVFGPEDRGLNTEELTNCRYLVRIPSASEYPSYNLAQAVLLALYQISMISWGDIKNSQEEREMPLRNDFYQLERMIENVLKDSGFTRPGSPQHSPTIIKRLFIRMNPDKKEMGILLAMMNRIENALNSAKTQLE